MTTATIKVCPNCGCEHFHVYQTSSRIAILDGNRELVAYHTLPTIDDLSSTMECIECHHNYTQDDLITDEQFHEQIITSPIIDGVFSEDIPKNHHLMNRLMWASFYTFVQDDDGRFSYRKNSEPDTPAGERFKVVPEQRVVELLKSNTKTLVVLNDNTYKVNFSL